MITKGEIFLLSKDGTKYKSRHFKSKLDRKKIIQSWDNIYKFSKKPFYYITVVPELPEPKRGTGYVSIYIDRDFIDDMIYEDKYHRISIIEKWIQKYNLQSIDYILYIIPNEPD